MVHRWAGLCGVEWAWLVGNYTIVGVVSGQVYYNSGRG